MTTHYKLYPRYLAMLYSLGYGPRLAEYREITKKTACTGRDKIWTILIRIIQIESRDQVEHWNSTDLIIT